MNFGDDDLVRLVAELLQRRPVGFYVPRRAVAVGGWVPESQQCHLNVELWCRANPTDVAVRGFLDFSAIRLFLPHSVVRHSDGGYVDITPAHDGAGHYRFIPHQGSEEFFDFVRQFPGIKY